MEVYVVGLIVADHEVAISVVSPVLIHMMNNRFFWKRAAEGTFSDQDMLPDISAMVCPRMADRPHQCVSFCRAYSAVPLMMSIATLMMMRNKFA
jgi:hypothetical protein